MTSPGTTSSSWLLEPFPPMPMDVARLIVESAAFQDTSDTLETSCALSLVSREAQRWSDRYFFRNVSTSSREPNPRWEYLLSALTSHTASSRIRRARSYVLTFSTEQWDLDESLMMSLLSECPQVTSLALWTVPLPSAAYQLHFPSLRRMTLALQAESPALTSPLFTSITHLDVTTASWSLLKSLGLQHLPSVTHLVLQFPTLSIGDPWEAIRSLDSILPTALQLLLVVVKTSHLSHPCFKDLLAGKKDVRMVLCVDALEPGQPDDLMAADIFESCFQEWCGRVDEEDTYWYRGMQIVEERRKKGGTEL